LLYQGGSHWSVLATLARSLTSGGTLRITGPLSGLDSTSFAGIAKLDVLVFAQEVLSNMTSFANLDSVGRLELSVALVTVSLPALFSLAGWRPQRESVRLSPAAQYWINFRGAYGEIPSSLCCIT
jgi:hypothetical protein